MKTGEMEIDATTPHEHRNGIFNRREPEEAARAEGEPTTWNVVNLNGEIFEIRERGIESRLDSGMGSLSKNGDFGELSRAVKILGRRRMAILWGGSVSRVPGSGGNRRGVLYRAGAAASSAARRRRFFEILR